jgi:hypothetical protein
MSGPALRADPTLDGVHLTGTSTSEWSILHKPARRTPELSHGGHREYLAWPGALQPQIKTKLQVVFTWESLRTMRDTVEQLLAAPGPHELALWRNEWSSWYCDGAAAEFSLPWRLAPHVVSTAPNGLTMARFDPVTKVGLSGTPLTYLPKAQAAYDADEPAAGEVWYLEGGQTFKLSAAPTAGAVLYASVVPVYLVFEGEPTERRYTNPAAEPRRVAFLER